MGSVDLHGTDGSTAGTVELADEVFAAPVNVPAMHQVVVAQQAAARRGTSKTKTRAEVRGGGAKPYRQKGTGRARQGSTRAPQWTGGGVAHGPTGVETYTKRVNKKLKRVALRSALSDRAISGDVRVVRDLRLQAPRTKDAVALLSALDLADRKVLVVLDDVHPATMKSFRNLPLVHLLTVDQLNTYDVLVSDVVVFAEAALSHIGLGTRSGRDAVGEPTRGLPRRRSAGWSSRRRPRTRRSREVTHEHRTRRDPRARCAARGRRGDRMSTARDVILAPVVSEKSYSLLDDGRYTFLVRRDANKTQIKQAVTEIFGVDVVSVNTLNRKGKRKRFGLTYGRRKDTKRAIVTLAEGETIDIFETGV